MSGRPSTSHVQAAVRSGTRASVGQAARGGPELPPGPPSMRRNGGRFRSPDSWRSTGANSQRSTAVPFSRGRRLRGGVDRISERRSATSPPTPASACPRGGSGCIHCKPLVILAFSRPGGQSIICGDEQRRIETGPDFSPAMMETNIRDFLKEQLHGAAPEDYLIRVNRQPVPEDYVLQEGDRVTATPTKIEGALA